MRHRARLTIGLPALLIAVLLITALLLATCDGGDDAASTAGRSKTATADWLARTAAAAPRPGQPDPGQTNPRQTNPGQANTDTDPDTHPNLADAPASDPGLRLGATPTETTDAPAKTLPDASGGKDWGESDTDAATATPTPEPPDAPAPPPPAPTGGPPATRVDRPQTTATPGDPMPATEAAQSAPDHLDVERIARAIVRIEAAAGDLSVLAFGSGTIIDADGLILTNFHVIDPAIGHDTVLVGITTAVDEAPRERYRAEVLIADPALDLAVLRLVATADGARLDPATLDLIPLALGDSNDVRVLDRVLAFGYPDIGDETLTVTAGAISGFLSQIGVEERRAWFKTDTTISFGNSGGAAVNAAGALVGVPTQGRFDAGGSLASLRPINLALPLIDAARRGERDAPIASVAANTSPILGITVGAQLSPAGAVLGAALRFDAGATYLVYSFRFQGLRDGVAWVDRWSRDGLPIPDLSTPRPNWQAGETGEFVTAIENPFGFADGVYRLEIVFDGVVLARHAIAIGDVPLPGVTIDRVVFGQGVDAQAQPTGVAQAFPTGLPALFAFYDYSNAGSAQTLRAVWRRDGAAEPVFVLPPSPWAGGDQGRACLSLTNDTGIPAGEYEIEIRFDGVLAARATVRVEASPSLTAALPEALPVSIGESRSGSVADGEIVLFVIEGVPGSLATGQGLLIQLSGNGDADLYVRAAAPPTLADLGRAWDQPSFQAPFSAGSQETVFIDSPAGQDWYILVAGAGAAENVTLSVQLRDGPPP